MHKYRNILIHFFVWGIYISLPAFILPKPSEFLRSNEVQFVVYFIIATLSIGFYYFNSYFALPKYFFNRKYLWYVVSVVCFIAVSLLLTKLVVRIGFSSESVTNIGKPELYINYSTRFILILIVSISMRVNLRLRQAKADKIKAELSSLKAQINPHFLFNVLNDIYGQAITNSEHTADSIAKLSSIMRHVLTEVNEDFISLEKEIKYLKSYVELQKIRLTNKTKVIFEVGEKIDPLQVPPLLFINFIENAFKYGVSNEVESAIIIKISTQNASVFLMVKNDKIVTEVGYGDSHNMGIENAKRRLDLMFQNRYTLNFIDNDKSFQVKLIINFK